MSSITTHVLDTARGRPANGVPIVLEMLAADGAATLIGRDTTDVDGRVRQLVPESFTLTRGNYRITFDTKVYFAAQKLESFYPQVTVLFAVSDPTEHYHVPLLLSPFGY